MCSRDVCFAAALIGEAIKMYATGNRYHKGKYFALVPDPESTTVSPYIGTNTPAIFLPTEDVDAFIRNADIAWLSGTSLAIDFVFPAYPDNHGHWTETLFPMIRAFSDGAWCKQIQGDGVGIPEFGVHSYSCADV